MDKMRSSESALSPLQRTNQSHDLADSNRTINFYILRGTNEDTPRKLSFIVSDLRGPPSEFEPSKLECVYRGERSSMAYLWKYSTNSSRNLNDLSLILKDNDTGDEFPILDKLIGLRDHNFLLNLNIANKKTWSILNKTKPGEEIDNPIQKLSFISYFIIDSDDPIEILSYFIPSYISYFEKAKKYKGYSKQVEKDITLLFETLDCKLESEPTCSGIDIKSYSVLLIIGMLQSFYEKIVGKEMNSSVRIFEALYRDLRSYEDHPNYENFKEYIMYGIKNLLAIKLRSDNYDSLNLLISLPDTDEFEEILLDTLTFLRNSYPEYLLSQPAIRFIIEILNNRSNLTRYIELFKCISGLNDNMQDFLELLYWCFMILTNRDKANDEESMRELMDKLNEFLNQLKPSLDYMHSILKYISDKPPLKNLFKESTLRSYIEKSLFKYSDLNSAVEVYRSILSNYFDPEYDIQVLNISKHLLDKRIDIYTVMNLYNFETKDYSEIIQTWLKKFNLYVSANEFNLVERQLSRFDSNQDSEFLSCAASALISRLKAYVDTKEIEIYDYFDTFYRCRITSVQDKYKQEVIAKIFSASTRPNIDKNKHMNRILHMTDIRRYPDRTKLIKDILSHANSYLMGIEDISSEAIFINICENPSSSYHWHKILYGLTNAAGEIDITEIITRIWKLITDVLTKSITFREIKAISKHDHSQREAFKEYIAKTIEIKQTGSITSFMMSLECALQDLKEKLSSIELVKVFIDRICTDLIELETIESDYESAIDRLDSNALRDFDIQVIFPNIVSSLSRSGDLPNYIFKSAQYAISSSPVKSFSYDVYLAAKSFYPFADSQVFSNCFNFHKSKSEFNFYNIPNIIESTIMSVRNIATISNELPANLPFLSINTDQIPAEIEILNKEFGITVEDKDILRNLLFYYNERERIKITCDSIILMNTLLTADGALEGPIEREILELCADYVSSIGVSEQKLNNFISISSGVCSKLKIHFTLESEHIRVYKITEEYSNKPDLIKLIKDLKSDELEYLKHSVNDHEECLIMTKAMLDLENIWSFHIEMKKVRGFDNLFNKILELTRLPIYQDLVAQIESCYSSFREINELYIELIKHDIVKNNQIADIYHSSRFSFKQDSDGDYDIELTIKENSKVKLSLANLSELKSRASLILYTSEVSNEAGNEKELYSTFIKFVTSVASIITSLNNLHSSGYLIDDDFKREVYTMEEGDIRKIKQLDTELDEKFKQWEKDLLELYQSYYWTTYLNLRQFSEIEKCLNTGNLETNQAKYFLQYISKELNPEHPKLELNPKYSSRDRLENIGRYLDDLPIIPSQDLDLIVSIENRIVQEPNQILYCETSKYLHGILTLYVKSGRKPPRADQIFFCKMASQFHELVAFLNRCFFNPVGELYLIISCENLSLDIQHKFKKLFNELYINKLQDSRFQLGIVTGMNSDGPMAKYFRYKKGFDVIRMQKSQILSDEEVTKLVSQIDSSTQVITSENAGLGKSHYIKKQAKIDNKILITVTIAGHINLQEIYAKLCSISMDGNTYLHFNIMDVDNVGLLNEMLMSFSMFRFYYTSYGVICIPRDCTIYIEVANTYNDSLFNGLSYLSYLKRLHIERMDLSRLEPNLDLQNDPIQFVSSYLNLYKQRQLDSIEIYYDYSRGSEYKITDSIIIQELYTEFFLGEKENQTSSYTQLEIFTKILDYLLRNFVKSPLYSIDEINRKIRDFTTSKYNLFSRLFYGDSRYLTIELQSLRRIIFESLLKTTMDFTTKSVSSVRERQIKNISAINSENLNAADDILIPDLKFIVSWKSANHLVLMFDERGSMIPIYKSSKDVPIHIRKHIFLNENALSSRSELLEALRRDSYDIEDISQMTHEQLLNKLNTIYNRRGPEDKYLYDDYVVTPDNFLKMNLIYLRVMAGIPVILMGNTGCGKTYLIKFFANEVLKHKFKVINIHAGVTSGEIRSNLNELDHLANNIPEGEKLWVFFDEFNTSDCMGLISEIMCKHTIDGNKLSNNLAFLGACNQYSVKLKKLRLDQSVGIKKNRKNTSDRLMYTVKTLPDSMIEYVWDFGALEESDVRKYIESMLKVIDNGYSELFVNVITFAHRYLTENEDSSSVSLRDVKRFLILYKWFGSSIEIKQRLENDRRYLENAKRYGFNTNPKIKDVNLRAGILATYHCYLLRISSELDRKDFLLRLCKEVGDARLNVDLIISVIAYEQYDYMIRMEIPEGTALNTALRENIYAIIPCIMNQIPIFVCGKPGCSKSLAIQLIFANLRGFNSSDSYFKTLPELSMFSFQGSESCTSDGIMKVFDRAKKSNEAMKLASKNRLPVVIFDEIGLAEISKYNPLKVLHSLLELEDRTVGFVGISNWRLDASKMNRAIYLARPDPSDSDLRDTAITIYLSCSKGSNKYEAIIRNLANSYSELKLCYKNTPHCDFYGLRDFYHLIKQVSNNLIQIERSDRYEEALIVQRAIERNFGGLDGAAKIMGDIFCKKHKLQDIWASLPKSNVIELINYNLRDKGTRYLMLITKEDLGPYILDKHLNISIDNRRMLVGSNLEDDLNQEDYGFRSLSDVILYAEKGISVIFKDMEHIYSSLYDLFNQSFSVNGNRRHCRIALGAYFNPKCFIHENFHAIVLINDEDGSLDKADAPFLNRFEKHYLSLEDILTEDQKAVLNRLEAWINLIMTPSDSNCKILLSRKSIFPIYSEQSIKLLVLYTSKDMENDDIILDRCKDLLLKSASSDILVLTQISSLNEEEAYNIRERWRSIHSIDFRNLLESLINGAPVSESNKVFIYTTDHKEISNRFFNTDLDEKIVHNNISSFKSEHELRRNMLSFFNSSIQSVYLLELDYYREGIHLPMLKYLVDKLESETMAKWPCLKSIVVIVRIARNVNYQATQHMFEGWDYWMFNELEPKQDILDEDFLKKSTAELISLDKLNIFDSFLIDYIEQCMLKFKYESTSYKFEGNSLYKYIETVIENISKDQEIRSHFKTKIIQNISASSEVLKDWKVQIFCDPEIIRNSTDLQGAIIFSICKQLELAYTQILFILEENGAINSYFTYYDTNNGEVLRQIWASCFERLTIDDIRLRNMTQGNLIKFGIYITFPFIKDEYKLLSELYNQYSEDTLNDKFIGDPEEHFIISFRKRTILKDTINSFKSSKELKELYYRNLIKLQISENLLKPDSENLYYSLYSRFCDVENEFEANLFILFKLNNEKLFTLTITLMDLYRSVSSSDLLNQFIRYEMEFDSDSKEIISKNELSGLVDRIISEFVSKSFILGYANNIGDYVCLVEKMWDLIYSLKYSHKMDINNIETIEFWFHFSKLLTKLDLGRDLLIEVVNIQRSESESEDSCIFKPDFSDSILKSIEKLDYYKTDDDILKFTSAYLCLLVENNPDWLKVVAKYIQETDIWRYSSKLIEIIIDKSDLSELLSNLCDSKNIEDLYYENGYILELESIFKRFGLDCKLGIILSDKLINSLDYVEESDDEEDSKMKHDLVASKPIFDTFFNLPEFENDERRFIKKLIKMVILRKSYDIYSYILAHNIELDEKEQEVFDEYSTLIVEGPLSELLRSYCMKRIKQTRELTYKQLHEYIIELKGINWVVDETSTTNREFSFYPMIPRLSKQYLSFKKALMWIIDKDSNHELIDKYIMECSSSDDRLVIGLGFQNVVFSRYSNERKDNRNIIKWYEDKKQVLIEHYLGKELSNLIYHFIHNFPEASRLKLSSEKSKEHVQIHTMCFALNVILSRIETPSTILLDYKEDIQPVVSNLRPITYRVLHFILHTVLHYSTINGNIQSSYIAVKQDLNTIRNSLDTYESHLWIYHIISLLPEYIPTSAIERNDFEIKLEHEIINRSLENVSEKIQTYKQNVLKVESIEDSFISTIEEINDPEFDEKFFRIVREPSYENMARVYDIRSLQKNYPILGIYLKHYESLDELEAFYPIIELTNYLLRDYNHTKTRRYARDTPMSKLTSENKDLRDLYNQFLKAWKKFKSTELEYEDTKLKAKKFDTNTPLMYFLVDNKFLVEEAEKKGVGGIYMAAVITRLAKLQNSILSEIAESLAHTRKAKDKYIIDKHYYAVQSIKSENILSYKLGELVEVCYLNDYSYGRGKEVIYDYDRLEKNLYSCFINSKFLDTKLNLIQYQYELCNTKSGIISDIRNSIPQKELGKNDIMRLEEYMKELQKLATFESVLREIYSSLNNLLCYLMTAGMSPKETLCSFSKLIKRFKLSNYLTHQNMLSNLSLEYIVALYEYIEEKYSPNILLDVKPEYKSEVEKGMIVNIAQSLADKCKEDDDELGSIEMIKRAVIRFVARFLSAEPDPKQPIKYYLMNRDFWDVSVSEEMLNRLNNILSDEILLEHSILFYKTLIGILNTKSKKRTTIAKRAKAPSAKLPNNKLKNKRYK